MKIEATEIKGIEVLKGDFKDTAVVKMKVDEVEVEVLSTFDETQQIVIDIVHSYKKEFGEAKVVELLEDNFYSVVGALIEVRKYEKSEV